jgi:hypothetical protein
MVREIIAVAILLLSVQTLIIAAPVAPNGASAILNASFEEGASTPLGWTLSGGVGTWGKEGHTGSRCISVTGDGKSSNFWKCPLGGAPLGGILPAAHYRIDFWTKSSPDASGGTVIAGTDFCNVDWSHTKEWTHRSIVFRMPNRWGEQHYFRFGQWEAKGKVYFDDIRIYKVELAHNRVDGGELGAGETIRDGRYEFVAPVGRGLNFARPMEVCTANFNSNRWLLSDGQWILFHHGLRPDGRNWLPLKNARVEVDVGYYVAGRCAVIAGSSGDEGTTIGTIDRVGTADFSLPAQLDGEKDIVVSLVAAKKEGESRPCSLQVRGYRFVAETDQKDLNLTGETYAILHEPAIIEVDVERDWLKSQWDGSEKAWQMEANFWSVGAPSLGGKNQMQIIIINRGPGALDLVSVVSVDETKQSRQPIPTPPASRSMTVELSYDAGRAGSHQAKVELLDKQTSEALFRASWQYTIPSLYDWGFGYAVAPNYICGLWWAEGTYKINRRCPMPEREQPISISAAKGEYEPFQLVMAPKRDLRGVQVKVSALKSEGGAQIPAEAVAVCRVGYVNVTDPTDEIGCAGEWPDPLPPLDKPFDLRASEGVQPLWFTVHVPHDTAAGDYRGTIDLVADDWKTSVSFTVHVWNFEIPRENHLKTAFGFSTGNVRRYHNLTSDEELRQVVELYFKNFAEHRISPYDPAPFDPIQVQFPKDADGPVKVDFSRFDKQAEKHLGPDYRFSMFQLHLSGMGGGTFHARRSGKIGRFEEDTPEYTRLFTDYLRQLESHLREKGWLDKAYIYWFDEPEPKDYDFVRAGMERIHRAAPGLRRMLTEQPEKELDGAVDIWCPVSPNVKPDDVTKERAKGNEFWWYICTGPKGPYCTLFIDHYAIEFRMWSWQTWKLGIQGLLIWQTNYWTSDAAFPSPQIQNPWEDPMSYVSGYSTAPGTKRHWGNGDGRFLYPPNRDPERDKSKYLVGPVNSIRWEMLREGIEDYEYFWLLRDLVEKTKKRSEKGDALARAEQLLTIPDAITRDQTHFTHDPLDLYRYRTALAEAIVALSK